MHRALRDSLAIGLDLFLERQGLAHLLHHPPVHIRDLFSGHRATQRDVERRVVRADPRALLDDLVAEGLAQRLVQQVRGRVVSRNLRPARRVDRRAGRVADSDLTGDDRSEVRDHTIRGLLGVLDAHAPGGRGDGSGVADLPTRLCVERTALDEHLDRIALRCTLDRLAVLAQRGDLAVGRELAIAGELRPWKILDRRPHLLDGASRPLTLGRHRRLEALIVDLNAAFIRKLTGELELEAERVVQLERLIARDAFRVLRDHALELVDALLESSAEAPDFVRHRALNLGHAPLHLWICVMHDGADLDHHVGKRPVESDTSSVDGRPANQATQHIPTTLV